MFDSKDFLKDLFRKIIASLIIYLIAGVILAFVPNIYLNTANFLACFITAISIWVIYFFGRKVLSILPPIIINIIFILVFILGINFSQIIRPTVTATPVIGQLTLVPTPTNTPNETLASSLTAKLTIEPSKPAVPTLTLTPRPRISASETSTHTQILTFTPPSPGSVFKFDTTNYTPNMFMGSVGDLQAKLVDLDTMTYQFMVKACDLPDDQGYYQWDQLFIVRTRNTNPPHFSGILYTDGSYGQTAESGNDLSQYSQLKWEVRSLQGEVELKFLIGGVKWTWDYQNGIKVPDPFPDTIPPGIYDNAPVIAIKKINNEWLPMSVSLIGKDLRKIHGGFGWLLDYQSNNVKIPVPSTCSDNPPTFIFEIRNVRYEK